MGTHLARFLPNELAQLQAVTRGKTKETKTMVAMQGTCQIQTVLVSALVGIFLRVVHDQPRLKVLPDFQFKIAIFQRFPL